MPTIQKIDKIEKEFYDKFVGTPEKEGNVIRFYGGIDPVIAIEIKNFYRQAFSSLIEGLESKIINEVPHIFPELESDDFDRGSLRTKREVLALLQTYKVKE